MPNDVKRGQPGELRNWTTLLLGSAALAVLGCALPLPSRFGDLLRAGSAQAAAGGPAGAAVLVIASCVVWPLLVWGCAVLMLAAATRLPGGAGRSAGRALRRVLPAALRRVLVAGLGVSIGVGAVACGTAGSTTTGSPAASYSAAGHPAAGTGPARFAAPEGDAAARAGLAEPAVAGLQLDWPAAPGAATVSVLTSLPELDWPVASAPVAATPRSGTPAAQAQRPTSSPPAAHRDGPRPADAPSRTSAGSSVTVRPGDTLWAIAAAALPAGSDAALIDRTWRAWYATNASVIGADPNLILPGQQLFPPTLKDAS